MVELSQLTEISDGYMKEWLMIPMVNFSFLRISLFKRYGLLWKVIRILSLCWYCYSCRRVLLKIMTLSIGNNATASKMMFLASLQLLLKQSWPLGNIWTLWENVGTIFRFMELFHYVDTFQINIMDLHEWKMNMSLFSPFFSLIGFWCMSWIFYILIFSESHGSSSWLDCFP